MECNLQVLSCITCPFIAKRGLASLSQPALHPLGWLGLKASRLAGVDLEAACELGLCCACVGADRTDVARQLLSPCDSMSACSCDYDGNKIHMMMSGSDTAMRYGCNIRLTT